MYVFTMTQGSLNSRISLAILAGLLASSVPIDRAQAQTSCGTGLGGTLNISGPYPPPNDSFIHVGEVARINSAEIFSTATTCTATNLQAWVIYPDNTFQEFLDNFTLPSGGDQLCFGTASGPCLPFTSTYLVKLSDVQNTITFATNHPTGFTFAINAGPQPRTVQFGLAAAGNAVRASGGLASAQQVPGLTVLSPCILVTKQCANT